MNRHVNAIAGRLSLRPPQRRSLEILDRVTEIVAPRKGVDIENALAVIRSEFPTVTDFERDFPSVCFALATGVGKTRLMGAFISYLHLAHGINNFFVLAPNLTIYNKLTTDFTPNTPKYVFTGVAEFATEPPDIITGDNYEGKAGTLFDQLLRCKVNIFNISKINSEVRGGKAPRIKRLSEYIGESYFDYLANMKDLVLLMDESHRYRASAGVRAINELKPVMGLELTATPFIETSRGPVQFKNVIYDYPLGKAMADGFVKEPAVVTQKNFDPTQFTAPQIEEIKLQDGVRLHENTKVELETYARQTGTRPVKPFMLIIARDTTHAAQLMQLIQSEKFFEGRYKDKVIQVDSSKTGAEEDEMIQRLLAVETPEEPTEIVIHVNMLKEGWDVTKGEVTTGFHPFKLDCSSIRYQPVERDLLIQYLRTNTQQTLGFGGQFQYELRLEDYLVRGLIDFDDISYDEHADLLYNLAGQMVAHLRSYLSADETRNVLIYHQKQLAAFIHAQMQDHQWEKATDYEVVVTKGFTELKEPAYTAKEGEPIHDFRETVEEKSRIPQMLFGGFRRCLYTIQKFQSDPERKLSVILDRETQKWFKPAKGQFQIFYKAGIDPQEYVPDFVAENHACIYMLEPKARNEMTDPEVLAKKEAAVKWCGLASDHALGNGGKPWKYALIPHDAIAENMTLAGLVTQFGAAP